MYQKLFDSLDFFNQDLVHLYKFSFVFFTETLFSFLNFDFELTFKVGEGLVEVFIITTSSSLSKFTAREAAVL